MSDSGPGPDSFKSHWRSIRPWLGLDPSPYVKDPNRLGDVIAAIQVMAVYKFYKRSFAKWAERIVGDDSEADHWEQIFREHPEFFRLGDGRRRASLVWRRSRPKDYNVDNGERLTRAAYKALDSDQKDRISRAPLSSNEISILINAAIDLHARALARRQELRWWIPAVIGLGGLVLGVVFG